MPTVLLEKLTIRPPLFSRVAASRRVLKVPRVFVFIDLSLGITGPLAGAIAAGFGFASIFLFAAVARFGRIDVLVNNAGYGQLAPFEDNFSQDAERQFATNVFGVLHVCRAVLPVMRRQRSGRVFNLSSMGGVLGMGGAALYCASKFAVEGFSESLAQEVAPFGIKVTLVEPGVFRTDFLDPSSAVFGARALEDYAGFTAKVKAASAAGNHLQTGSPEKLGAALVHLASHEQPPLRYLAGSDAYQQVSAKLKAMLAQIEEWRELTCSTDGV